jgi:hypothetical protein
MAQSSPTVAVETLSDTITTDDSSRNVLVHLTGTEIDHRLVREAGRHLAGTGGKLVLVNILPSEEFTERQQAYASISALPAYTLDQAKESRRQRAHQIGRHALEPLEIDYTAVAMVGRETGCCSLRRRDTTVITSFSPSDHSHCFVVSSFEASVRQSLTSSMGSSPCCNQTVPKRPPANDAGRREDDIR